MTEIWNDPFEPDNDRQGNLQSMGIYVRRVSSFYGPMIQVNSNNPYQPHRDTVSFKENDEKTGTSSISS